MIQLHCPPTDLYYKPEVFEALDSFVEQGKVQHYGVSVEKVEEGLKAIEYPGVASVMIIFNIFRQRPMKLFFKECRKRNVAIIARVPLAMHACLTFSPYIVRSTSFFKKQICL